VPGKKTNAQAGLFDADQPTVYLIDGTAYIYRAYHAIRNLSNSKGMPTNAIFGFTRMLLKLMSDKDPQYVGVFFDAKGPTFRHERYPEYKANRPPMADDLAAQIPHIKRVVAAFGLKLCEMEGFEADDLIGTVAQKAQKQTFQVEMVTGDKDFVQLVTDKAEIWDPMKEQRIDIASVREQFGLEPHQMIDVMGFSGDSADNVPGIPGIGPKTALALIQRFESMDALYNKIDQLKLSPKQRERLEEFREQALLSRELVAIDTAAPIDFDAADFTVPEPDRAALTQLFQEFEFRQLQEQYFQSQQRVDKNYQAVLTLEALEALAAQLRSVSIFALDTETTSQTPMLADLVGISIAFKPHEAFYIPVGHRYPDAPEQLTIAQVKKLLQPVLKDPAIAKVGQNIKYDWAVLERNGFELAGVTFDTMVASYLLNPSLRGHGLDQIALNYLGHKNITYKETVGADKQKLGFRGVSLDKAVPYAAEDADITLLACNHLRPELEQLGLMPLFDDVEMPLVEVLLRMEQTGVCVDRGRLRALSEQFYNEIKVLEAQVWDLAGEQFNVNSSQQLGKILFENLGLPVQKKTRKRTGYSTDVEVLQNLEAHHELPGLVIRYRTLGKLKSTYADALLELIHPRTGRIHTSFNQTVAATGRLSSSDPNLQNIPIRTEEGRQIRSAFVARDDWVLLSADYSQIELRLLAHFSQDPRLIKAFNNDEDIHTHTAAEVFEADPEAVSAELRRQAKVINFGIIYGMGAFSLAKELGISNKMAATFIDNYFARYEGVKRFIDETIAGARESDRTSTLLGRIRLLPEINSRNYNMRAFAERTAVNTPIQGSAADLIKVAMINMERHLREGGFRSAMLLSVHDEIVFEVPPEELEQIKTVVTETMEGVWQLAVPLKVNVAWGKNWAEAH
jgi:DNA polymerase-1